MPITSKYLSVAQADVRYTKQLSERLFTTDDDGEVVLYDVWSDSSTEEREQALFQATSYIDSFTYDGEKADPNQEKQFPRKGQTETPEQVAAACFDLALFFLRQYKVREFSDGYRQRLFDEGVTRFSKQVDDFREEVHLGSEKEAYSILRPYLRKWLTGRYRAVRFEV